MRTLILAIVCTVFMAPVYADAPANYPFLSYDEGLRVAQKTNKPIFLYFGRHGCGWCEKTNKEVFAKPALRESYPAHFVLVYVDSESGDRLTLPSGERITEMELGARFKVFATPLFAYLKPNGEMIFKISGFQSVQDFQKYDRFVTERHYERQDIREYLRAP